MPPRRKTPPSARRVRRPAGAALVVCLLAFAAAAQTISPDRLFGRYRQFAWQDQHGLPQNGISDIVRTPDGYLWLAIAEGVARFDGVNFVAFDTGNTPELKSNNVQALAVGRDGTLWIGTHGGGLTSMKAGRFATISTAEGLTETHVTSLFEDSRGTLWAGTDGGGVNLLRDGRVTAALTVDDGLPGNYVRAFAEDESGDVWIGTTEGLARWHDSKLTKFSRADGLAGDRVEALAFDRAKRLWIGGDGVTVRTANREFVIEGARDGIREVTVQSIAEGKDGDVWLGTRENGIYRYRDGRFENSTAGDGLVNDNVQAILADDAGDVWLGTSGGGLAQLHLGRFSVISRADGLPGDMAGAVFEDSTGAVWIGTDEGLARVEGGKLTVVRTADGRPLRSIARISEDRDRRLWIWANERGLGGATLRYIPERRVVEVGAVEVEDRASSVLHDRDGRVWVGTTQDGVQIAEPGGTRRRLRKSDGLADDYVTDIFEDRDGGVWIGTRAGVSRVENGRVTTFGAAAGFTGRHVLAFHQDARGDVWIGTDGDGLFRFRDGRFGVVTSRAGLYDNLAFSILEDDAGNLWMSGNRGIYRASIADLDAYLDGLATNVRSFSYGVADGMLSRECNGANPAGVRTRDGRLWFPTVRGVVVVDPRLADATPPRVSVEGVYVDDVKTRLADGAELTMTPEDENLEIRFGAISWNRPAQIRFKYRLAGLDADWVDAGTRRTAYYPHIAPGTYTFQVIADNGEGVWNETGSTFRMRVLPPFYQTWWFLLLCAVAVALIIRLVYQYRLRQLEKLNEVRAAFTRQLIDYQEKERKRVAVELHDSIGQSLIVIRNRALMSLGKPDDVAQMIVRLEEISESAADSIQEIRQVAHNLHPYQLEHLGLRTALESMIEQASEASTTEFNVTIGDIDDHLSKESEVNFYRIVQESVNNILKHSEATAASITIDVEPGRMRLEVADNGKGFAADEPDERGLGLAGIAERARMLGAELAIRSGAGHGTTVSVVVRIQP